MDPLSRLFRSPYAVACASAAMLVGTSGAATAATVVTSSTGNVSVGSRQLEQNDIVDTSDRVDIEGNGSASLLVENSTVVRLCNDASLGFGNDHGNGPNALSLAAGQAKISAGKRANDDPLEVHTPAAIVTLLGTEAHVVVDAETGDTVITSLAQRVRVEGLDTASGGAMVLSAGQKVTIRKGEEPGDIEVVHVSSLADTSACLDDARYRVAAVSAARGNYAESSLNAIALMDSEVDVPTVAAGPPIIPTGTLGPPNFVQSCLAGAQCAGPAPSKDPIFVPSNPGGGGGPGGPPGPPAP